MGKLTSFRLGPFSSSQAVSFPEGKHPNCLQMLGISCWMNEGNSSENGRFDLNGHKREMMISTGSGEKLFYNTLISLPRKRECEQQSWAYHMWLVVWPHVHNKHNKQVGQLGTYSSMLGDKNRLRSHKKTQQNCDLPTSSWHLWLRRHKSSICLRLKSRHVENNWHA